jgi:hypothetical protein
MKPFAETRQARYNYDRIFVKQGPPQGMTEEQFQQVSDRLRERLKQEAGRTGYFGDDIFVHGSRGSGIAADDADLDIGIRVSAESFDQGEAGISGIRKEIQRLINEEMNLGFGKGVQVTVIREAGPFDQGPFIPLRTAGS